jgi:DNA-binding NtrC family response regulator
MTHKILIADDEPNIVISLEYLMKREGYEVHGGARRAGGAGRHRGASGPTWCCWT